MPPRRAFIYSCPPHLGINSAAQGIRGYCIHTPQLRSPVEGPALPVWDPKALPSRFCGGKGWVHPSMRDCSRLAAGEREAEAHLFPQHLQQELSSWSYPARLGKG